MSSELLNSLRDRLDSSAESSVPDAILLDRVHTKKTEVTVGELRAAIDNNPRHEVAIVYARATKGMESTETVLVETIDLQALLDNSTVAMQKILVDGQPSLVKSLIPLV